ncbi:TonB-dependent receptor [Fulvivirga sp. 29W222]|uniref:TonB-dependent receptor n=1 Tax=Fulvivirga marina TaxID=2494733 RepID=A0A937KBG3_9BACT|nr:TonB-dependent receptor [Fulvivirga marina]MBL6445939.1 TonB-dependent receptor [Fulvivirga marina]
MKKIFTKATLLSLFLVGCVCFAFAQEKTTISGKVTDSGTGEPLAGVNIVVKGKVIGTITNGNGSYELTVSSPPPLTLVYSFIGFDTQEIEITEANTTLDVAMIEASLLGQEVVISASRVEESILESPVSIEKMDVLAIQNTAADSYYKGIGNLKGVDVTTSSINFQIVNARGFNSTGNTRFVQLTDGMDTQAPALNFPIGNLNGPSELDVESIEFIPGASSALYGPNAFNGILLVNSKSPFDYQGLSAMYKASVNHLGDSDLDSEGEGEIGPGSAQPMHEVSVRYAKAFNNKFAFKVNFSYSQAEDWYGTNLSDQASTRQPSGFDFNPGRDQVHAFGDEVANNIALVGLSSTFQSSIAGTPLETYYNAGDIPNQVVTRTPYAERYLVDYGAENMKVNTSLHYRLTDRMEILYSFNYGYGTTVYTGAQRYSLKNFSVAQHKLELKGDNFFVRGYTTRENSGDSYIADLTGVLINDSWKSNTQWYGEYTSAYLTSLAQQGATPGSPTTAQQMAAHMFARGFADVGRLEPGTDAFKAAKKQAENEVIPTGSLFDDATNMYHVEGQYDFKNQIDFMGVQVGASYKLYDLQSNGTVFADSSGNDITIQEVGAFVQLSKRLLNDKLKLTGSARYDKNENFDAQINPRISGVLTVADNNNIRVSYQTGFRNPTTQGQHIDLNVVSARLIGGLPQYAQAYNIYENAFTARSVEAFVAAVAADPSGAAALGNPANLALLERADTYEPVKPEEVRSIEIGYKSLLGKKLLLDFAYYHNTYNDFIAQVRLRKAAGFIDLDATTVTEQNIRNAQTLLTPISTPGQENTFQTYTNVDETVTAHGVAFGAEYSLGKGYKIGGNYNWNKLKDELSEGFLSEFNTPEHKFNVSLSNRKLTDKLGFNVTYRWQNEFLWESSFARGTVPSIGTMDAQVSYKLSNIKSSVKLGGSNITNERYVLNYGGPTIGAIYYVSITFDQLMN